MINEVWKDIKGYEGKYKISNFGRVKSISRFINCCGSSRRMLKDKVMKAQVNSQGYLRIQLRKGNTYHWLRIHRIVASEFLENKINKPQVNHIDGNKSNNNCSNLEFVTRLENMRHAVDNRLMPHGEKSHQHKLSCADVIKIRKLKKYSGSTQRIIASIFRVSEVTISNICRNKTWKY